MPHLAAIIFKKNNLMQYVNSEKFMEFFRKIQSMYSPLVPFDNDLHASDVAQHCHYILNI
jgi:hypothetical protein